MIMLIFFVTIIVALLHKNLNSYHIKQYFISFYTILNKIQYSLNFRASAKPVTAFAGCARDRPCHTPHRNGRGSARLLRSFHAAQTSAGWAKRLPPHACCRNSSAPRNGVRQYLSFAHFYHIMLFFKHFYRNFGQV